MCVGVAVGGKYMVLVQVAEGRGCVEFCGGKGYAKGRYWEKLSRVNGYADEGRGGIACLC
jgi:hypothetical protein